MKKRLIVKKFIALLLVFAMNFVLFIPANSFAAKRKKETKKGNNYPIVLCHGCNGWGRDEKIGTLTAVHAKYYWGGNVDFQQELIDRGYETYTASVGPLSSNWDRACELYAEIKGGTVDYGEAHSKRFGHKRFGRTYEGFCPDWGTENEDGSINKVHLIGHSQGGQTIRAVSALLGQGSEEERRASGDKVSELFKGGNSWLCSVTTFVAPHDGTTLVDVNGTNKIASIVLAVFGANLGNIQGVENIFDLQLDHFGLKRKENESFRKYLKRCLNSSMWTNSKDNCMYDLSTNGAVKLNKWAKAQPDTYYFSYGCKCTMRKRLSIKGHQVANPAIIKNKGIYSPAFAASVAYIGSYSRRNYSYEIPVIDKKWWPNDGMVNTISEDGPKYGSTDEIVKYNGKPQIGKWNYMGTKDLDHAEIIGIYDDEALNLFLDMAKMLRELPK